MFYDNVSVLGQIEKSFNVWNCFQDINSIIKETWAGRNFMATSCVNSPLITHKGMQRGI